MNDSHFQILVVRLLSAILVGQNWKTRRSERVLKDADAWVSNRQQAVGLPLTMDWTKDTGQPKS